MPLPLTRYPFRLLLTMLLLATAAGVRADAISGPAPDFTLPANTGKNLKLSEFRGQVVLLNFWASWCGPCRQEMPALERLHKRYGKLGFTVLGVNVEEDSNQARRLLSDVKVSFPILFDTRNQASRLYDVSAMPTTVIIDRDGNMRYLHKGYKPGEERIYKKWIRKLIRE